MSTLVTGRAARTVVPARPRRRAGPSAPGLEPVLERPAGGQTFDDVIAGAWEDLSAHRTATCPVCLRAALRPRAGAGPGAGGGRCEDCGTVLQ